MFFGFAPIVRNVATDSQHAHGSPDQRLSTLRGALDAIVEGRWDDAETMLAADRPIAMNDAAFLNLLGIVHQAKGQWKEARRYYGKAMKADPHYAPAEQNLRRVYELHTFGRTDLEISLIDSAVAIQLESRFASPLVRQCPA
jgi:tetratricopeptide (TPR) repeat protein